MNIVSVRPGMTMQQVRSILGEPISEEAHPGYHFYCPCNPEHTCWQAKRYTFVYTERRWGIYPMVWIHFNARRKVKEVYVKKYVLVDDWGIYLAKQDPCDVTDPIVAATRADSSKIDALTEFFERE